ncbi:UDP-N-acetyl-D-mannosamine dehydrogenase [Sphingomicrobium clamense]|uniref:UDP-N-acetyl-D-mannosamine dehydrogenase n=1 Tax=Sphingomicrobium clamense TaxID=2851013 RepID=A0ABS6V6L4_9SPHN|nr:UDP-N-acetyl-D-mannosamine dehydrogenase [Sphingomicrobium sp. B8]
MSQSGDAKTVSVIGLGYIGLPTAAAFASRRVNVFGVDVRPDVVETINRGEIHIVEPDLDAAVHWAVESGFLRAGTTPEPADAFLIAVPTPFVGENKEPDLSYIESASRAIAPVLKSGDLVILESTSPVGATEKMAAWLAEERADLSFPQHAGEESDIRIAHCPERVLPGKVMRELVSNDRIIGGLTPRCGEEAKALYELFVEGECILTEARVAEMCKLAENSFRDVNIAFANELSVICDKLDVNVWELIRLANHHPRVNILTPGAGVGGHCIAVDPWFIVAGAPEEAQLIRTAREVNDAKPDWVLERVDKAAARYRDENDGKNPTVAALGIAFKPDIDDLRESPACAIAESMKRRNGNDLLVVEPNVGSLPEALQGAQLVDADTAIEQADIIALLVGHKEFHEASDRLAKHGAVVDAVGILDDSRP